MIQSKYFTPAPGYLLIEPIVERDKLTGGGLIKPDIVEVPYRKAEVLAVGARQEDAPFDWNVGDVVLYINQRGTQGSPLPIEADGKEMLLLSDAFVIGRVERMPAVEMVQ